MTSGGVVAAVDLGATSGRVMLGYVEDGMLRLEQVARAHVADHAVTVAPHEQDRHADALQVEAAGQLGQQPPAVGHQPQHARAAVVMAGEHRDDVARQRPRARRQDSQVRAARRQAVAREKSS